MKYISENIERARELRKNQTPEEDLLWQNLRNRKLAGKKFVRQHPLIYQIDSKAHYFIADFYCHEHRLVVELDGGYHNTTEQQEYDCWRDEVVIECLKLNVLRIKNEEMINIEQVLQKIKACF